MISSNRFNEKFEMKKGIGFIFEQSKSFAFSGDAGRAYAERRDF
jgi:hypothetical protein